MTEAHAGDIALCSEATVAPRALTALADLLQSHLGDKLVQTPIPETEESGEAARVISSKSARRHHRSRCSTRPKGA